MALLTEAERLDLVQEVFGAQDPEAVVFHRLNENTGVYEPLDAQLIVRTMSFGRGASSSGGGANSAAIIGESVPIHWIAAPDADVKVGDWFEADGHDGGRVIRVRIDSILHLTMIDGTLPVGSA